MLFVWLKAFHVIAVIAWMAGLFYLPRLFVYHAQSGITEEMSDTFKIMERRLLKIIMNPAMILSWLSGLLLAQMLGQFSSGIEFWFVVKLALVVILTGFHMHMAKCLKEFASDSNEKSEHYFRIVNEVPTVLMIGIVIMVIVQPF